MTALSGGKHARVCSGTQQTPSGFVSVTGAQCVSAAGSSSNLITTRRGGCDAGLLARTVPCQSLANPRSHTRCNGVAAYGRRLQKRTCSATRDAAQQHSMDGSFRTGTQARRLFPGLGPSCRPCFVSRQLVGREPPWYYSGTRDTPELRASVGTVGEQPQVTNSWRRPGWLRHTYGISALRLHVPMSRSGWGPEFGRAAGRDEFGNPARRIELLAGLDVCAHSRHALVVEIRRPHARSAAGHNAGRVEGREP